MKPSNTPIDQGRKGEDIGDSVERDRYQQLVGKLIYYSHTKPDIAFTIRVVNQYIDSPKEAHLEVVYRIHRYLKGSLSKSLLMQVGLDQ